MSFSRYAKWQSVFNLIVAVRNAFSFIKASSPKYLPSPNKDTSYKLYTRLDRIKTLTVPFIDRLNTSQYYKKLCSLLPYLKKYLVLASLYVFHRFTTHQVSLVITNLFEIYPQNTSLKNNKLDVSF